MFENLMRWLNPSDVTAFKTEAGDPEAATLKRAQMQCVDETVDYTSYHLCAHDPVRQVVLCVGNKVPALLVARGRRQMLLQVPNCVRWIDCSIFSGTSSVLLLSPERLVLLDYAFHGISSALSPCGKRGVLFTSLHVPQGVTWGAVGCEDGTVMYWRLQESGSTQQLVWAALTTSTMNLCRPFFSSASSEWAPRGYVLSMNSSPSNPNTFIAVVAGAAGVCKWYVDENRLSRFFSLPEPQTGCGITACRYTPGASFVVAAAFDASALYIWAENGKKDKERSVALMWSVQTGCRPCSPVGGPNDEVVSSTGMYIAHSSDPPHGARSEKKSPLHFLLHSTCDIVELVINLEEKRLIQREDILSHIKAKILPLQCEGDESSSLDLCRVIPCVGPGYWLSEWKDSDLDTLLVLSEDLGPLLVRRSRYQRNVESAVPLRNVMPEPFPWDEMLLVSPPAEVTRAIWHGASLQPDPEDPWATVLACLECEGDVEGKGLQKEILLGMVPYSATGAVCFLPLTNECLPVSATVIEQNTAANARASLPTGSAVVILEEALPKHPCRTEFILRVLADEMGVSVNAVRFSPPHVEHIMTLSKEQLIFGGASVGDDGQDGEAEIIARTAKLADCRIEQRELTPQAFQLVRGGMSILLQLRNGNLVIVDLSGGVTGEGNAPAMVHYPGGLFPAGASVTSFDTVWMGRSCSAGSTGPVCEGKNSFLALFCTLSNDRGLIIWNMSDMQMLGYHREDDGRWSYDKVMLCSSTPQFSVSAGVASLVVRAPHAGVSDGKSDPSAEKNSDFRGTVSFRDVFGRVIFAVELRWCAEPPGGLWYGRVGGTDTEWTLLPSSNSKDLRLSVVVSGGEVVVSADGEYTLRGVVTPGSRIVAVEVNPGWPYDALQCDLHAEDEQEKQEEERSRLRNVLGEDSPPDPTVVLWNGRKVHLYLAERLLSGEAPSNRTQPPVVGRGRSVEQVGVCMSLRVVVVMSRDANGWRWFNVLDLESGQRLAEHTMLCLCDENDLRLHTHYIEGSGLHIYVVGVSGALGHLIVSAESNVSDQLRLTAEPLEGIRHVPAPPTFRSYLQFLPPPPAVKQEQGLLKRLTTQSWEEAATKIETNVLVKKMEGAAPQHPRPDSIVEKGRDGAVLSQRRSERKGSEDRRGSRYSELKAVAARENVSVTEALQMMRENEVKVHERGEKISQIESKSRELAQEATTFEALARKLNQKQKNSWF
ncbi:hypothetical protein, conserved [Trypanosoma brucei gambiense DAL972]|uniref:V-SNARE coiled-coil homology domain-containing protein n=1 Tax=Trypanosoma brucei gambiense (strain MHOM/CI/86/DAL972) TaxID=679716 RepID=D0AAA7_TRYB9|nr:hypothetical protein, conserved [Trypanosoma brucei gambiense DAL972]CBH18608.1 hypothetical protein, conserved [Trypanosoma brucei gambiense DAL972]|eukprot:XP_011780872.1 hypothetical protein, conserved [Trypanosoma brucei gambiense DAL972]